MSKLPPGHRWAYFGVGLGLLASIAGNVANTVLVESPVTLWLRVPFAVVWPVFLGIGIEVLTRIEWERNWKHWGARLVLVGPMSLVAGVMSYLHLNHLMALSGEPGLAQAIGPLAVDGTLFGCTVALLVTRVSARVGQREDPLKVPADLKVPEVPVSIEVPEVPALEVPKVPEGPRPVSPAGPGTVRTRGTRTAWDVAKAVHVLMDPEDTRTDLAIGDLVGVGPKVIQRTRRAVRLLKANPRAEVPAEWKVPAAVVQVIRQEVTR